MQVTKDPHLRQGASRDRRPLARPAGPSSTFRPFARSGVSRRISDDAERERLRQLLEELPGGGLIARTAAYGAGAAELAADRRYLGELAARIARQAEQSAAPALLHRELDLALRVVRDLVATDFAAIRVDDEATAARLREFLAAVAPALVSTVELYSGRERRSSRRSASRRRSRTASKHRVELPSGGSLVIQQTEALVAIDVNTGKFVGKDALEDTVFAANLEAVPEIARQIRLRDLGGLLVIDFIDMGEPEHRREIVERFEAELAKDRARTRLLQLSDFGLDRGHAAALARQPRKDADPLLPVLLRPRPRADRPDARARPAPRPPPPACPLHGRRDRPDPRPADPGEAPRGGGAGDPRRRPAEAGGGFRDHSG